MDILQQLKQCIMYSPKTARLWRYWQCKESGRVVQLIFWKKPKGHIRINRREYFDECYKEAVKAWSRVLTEEANRSSDVVSFAERVGYITILPAKDFQVKTSILEKDND